MLEKEQDCNKLINIDRYDGQKLSLESPQTLFPRSASSFCGSVFSLYSQWGREESPEDGSMAGLGGPLETEGDSGE